MINSSTVLKRYKDFILRPIEIIKEFRGSNLRPDLIAGLTVAVVSIPQSMAYASIAGLPPSYGLYTAGLASIVASLWGSSRFLSTGPTNAISILVLSILMPIAAVGSEEFMLAASIMAVMMGAFCIVFALSGLSFLVNFASRAVLIGFIAGAALLIAVGQLKHIFRIDVARSPHLHQTLTSVLSQLDKIHWISLSIGLGTILVILLCNKFSKNFPGSLIAMVGAGAIVAIIGADNLGVATVGDVPRALPKFATFSLSWMVEQDLIREMIVGALAVAALGLVEAASIARELARQSGQRLDVRQLFIGQGVANIISGLFGGYACSGSFTRSAVSFHAGARSQFAGVFTGLLVLAGVLAFGPLASYLPKASLAGLIMIVAYKMIDWKEVKRVFRTSRNESGILVVTFISTLFFPLEFAVLAGIILSLAIFIYQSSMPKVDSVVPNETYRHFIHEPKAPSCPQLAVISVQGPLFFGAASHVEDVLLQNYDENKGQNLLLLRLHGVNSIDLAGIEMIEVFLELYRDVGGDLYLWQVRPPVRELMQHSGFEDVIGKDHLLKPEEAIEFLFEKVLDPAVCCYECEHRVFAECQAIEKHPYDSRLPSFAARQVKTGKHLNVHELEKFLQPSEQRIVIVDVREPGEYNAGHIAGSRLIPLRLVIEEAESLPRDCPIVLISRSGRRCHRAMPWLLEMGFDRVYRLKGGILSWKAHGNPIEVD